MRTVWFLLMAASLGCGDDSTSVDAGVDPGPNDAGADAALTDASRPDDAGNADAGSTPDAGTDAARPADGSTDASTDDAGPGSDGAVSCHGTRFGAPEIAITTVASLPAMTGGTIVPGVYDAVALETTASLSGSFRGTWNITATTIEQYQQLALPAPGALVPRTLAYSVSGNELSRAEICPDASSFTNEFTASGEQLLIRQDTIMFTFRRR